MDVKKEQIQAAIDQIATLVVESIAEKEKKGFVDSPSRFSHVTNGS